MTYLPAAAHRLFARQHGVASLDQLVAAGLTRRQIETLRSNAAIEQNIRGAYRSASAPVTETMRCAEICVAHPGAVIGGPTAGRLHGFRQLPDDRRIHITASRHAHPITNQPGVVTFSSDTVQPSEIRNRPDGVRIMSPGRTAMDLARFLSGDALRSVIEQAMHDSGTSEADLLLIGADFLYRRPWVRSFMETVGSRVGGGPAESHAEVIVGDGLVRRGVLDLVRQHRLALDDRSIRFDLAVPTLRWGIEVDVFPTHQETAGALADHRRDAAVGELGWRVSRISRHDYERRLPERLDHIAAVHRAFRRRTPPGQETFVG